jgi:hypothetical protein
MAVHTHRLQHGTNARPSVLEMDVLEAAAYLTASVRASALVAWLD